MLAVVHLVILWQFSRWYGMDITGWYYAPNRYSHSIWWTANYASILLFIRDYRSCESRLHRLQPHQPSYYLHSALITATVPSFAHAANIVHNHRLCVLSFAKQST